MVSVSELGLVSVLNLVWFRFLDGGQGMEIDWFDGEKKETKKKNENSAY